MRCPRAGVLRDRLRWRTALAIPLASLLSPVALGAASASAQEAAPHWSIVAESQPTSFTAGAANDAYVVIARNDGAAPTASHSTVSIRDTLPPGVTATKITALAAAPNGAGQPGYTVDCEPPPRTETIACTYEGSAPLLSGTTIMVTIVVSIPAGAVALGPNFATVSGGGAAAASTSEPTPLGEPIAPFALPLFDVDLAGEDGEADTQAGSHPYELTVTLGLGVAGREAGGKESTLAATAPKDLEMALPTGLVGNPNAVPRCSQQAFLERQSLNCPLDTQVGTVKAFFFGSIVPHVYPVFNVVPPPGQPAELGFSIAGVAHIPLFFRVRDGEDYGLTAQLDDLPEAGPLQGAILTLWGVPAAESHDLEREGTLGEGAEASGNCQPRVAGTGSVEVQCPSGIAAKPFLTLPSDCQESAAVQVRGDSWEDPQPPPRPLLGEATLAPAFTGCEALAFYPSLALVPETLQAGVPSGYTLDVHVPQDEEPDALSSPDLRDATVSLPQGVVLSPSVGDGLEACSPQQFQPDTPEPGTSVPAACPSRSQIGTVKILTPLLSAPLEGDLFLGEPECSPCTASDAAEGRLVRLLAQAQGSPQVGGQAGVTVKLEGRVSIDQATGRLTASFAEDPQLPLEEVALTFDGGANAPLVNPNDCGAPLSASARLTPYSSETPAEPSSEAFELSGCTPAQFQPTLHAGTTDNQAGATSPLTVTLARGDRDEDLETLSLRLPPGLLGMVSKVQPCAEAQARAGTCAATSRIGSVTVEAGPGATPLVLEGSVYLTGPYEGAPYGLSIVVPALAGPLDLGAIVIGAKIQVDPSTAALTIASDPLPQSLDGIPLQIKAVDLSIDREGFIVNPTDCQPLSIEAAVASSAGATALVSSPFQAAACAKLQFKPKLTALTHAHTDKAGGVHLHVRIVSGEGQANIAKLKLDLPKRMVPRLTTWQRACPASAFEASPASCPAASVAGSATVFTPILRHPLSGSVYAISRGREASPEIALVLRGEGIVLDVIGQVSVKGGIAAAIFRSLPDVPISELDLILEAGPHSALAADLPASAHGSMCGRRLSMPTAITAQDGAVVKQTTTVAVSGCHPAKRKGRKK